MTAGSPAASLPQVGFVGLGDQGGPMAQAIASYGLEANLFTAVPELVQRLG